MRSVDSLRSSLAFIASLTALLMSSRSMFRTFHDVWVDLGRTRARSNAVPALFRSTTPEIPGHFGADRPKSRVNPPFLL
jgi:hypothetical protein